MHSQLLDQPVQEKSRLIRNAEHHNNTVGIGVTKYIVFSGVVKMYWFFFPNDLEWMYSQLPDKPLQESARNITINLDHNNTVGMGVIRIIRFFFQDFFIKIRSRCTRSFCDEPVQESATSQLLNKAADHNNAQCYKFKWVRSPVLYTVGL